MAGRGRVFEPQMDAKGREYGEPGAMLRIARLDVVPPHFSGFDRGRKRRMETIRPTFAFSHSCPFASIRG